MSISTHLRPVAAIGAPLTLVLAVAGLGGTSSAAAAPADRGLVAGGVFSQSNAPGGNEVVAFSRAADGSLTRVGSFATGGTGSGGFEDSANNVVLGTAVGEASPNNNIGAGRLLFVTNAGSDDISVFRVRPAGLELVERQPSGGLKPTSITVNKGVAYVLNSGEVEDGLVVPNCDLPNQAEPASITGFTVSPDGQLTPLPGSTRVLSDPSGCSQVSFNPAGSVLVVSERTARTQGQDPQDEGVLNTFVVRPDGTLGERRVYDASSSGPFGFTFTQTGQLLTSEQNDGPAGVGRGAAASYALADDGTLAPTGPAVGNGGTDSCWFVVTDNGRFGYVSSFFEGGQISRYDIAPDGTLAPGEAQADRGQAETGASDLALSRDSRYLHSLNSFTGTIDTYRVGADGALTLVDTDQAHDPSAQAAPFGLAAS
jgi:6-phosphogluconolactonase